MGRLANTILLLLALATSGAAGERVVVGAYVNDITALDLRTHSWSADVYVWFRWKDPETDPEKDPTIDPATTVGFVNAFELWGHTRTTDQEKPRFFPETGERYQVVRQQGRFSTKFDLTAYPFDRQVLTIELEEQALELDAVEFVPDEEPIVVNPQLLLPGFVLGQARLVVEPYEYPTGFGEPGHRRARFSRVRIEIPIQRPALTHGVKFLLPILCVVACAAMLFFFDPKFVESRAEFGITSLLTIVALQITLNEDLPEIDYLVLIDKLYLAAYFFVIASLGVVVRSSWLINRGEDQRAIRIDRRSLLALGLLFLLAVVGLIVTALRG